MTRLARHIVLVLSMLLVPSVVSAQVTVGPFTFTPNSASGTVLGQITLDGLPAASGDVVGAFDADGNTAGAARVVIDGGRAYLNVAVYGDDPTTADADEGVNGSEGFTLRLYDADADRFFELGETLTGWQNTNGAPMPGYSDTGRVFAFETPEVLPVTPVLGAPADGATGQPTRVVLSWEAAERAETYELTLATDAGFEAVVAAPTGLQSTTYEVSGLQAGATYHWRVRAHAAAGSSEWSAGRRFSTEAPAAPPSPAPLAPADGATGTQAAVTLSWSAAVRARTYEVMVASDAAFGAVVASAAGLTGTAYETTGLAPGTTYYWRIRAENAGGSSSWSTSFSFTTAAMAPAAPAPAIPADGAEAVGRPVTLRWKRTPAATHYTVEVADNASFEAVSARGTSLADTSYVAAALAAGTRYWWRVRATGAGGTGAWSAARTFTTAAPSAPSAPVLDAPVDNAEGVSRTPALVWRPADAAETYDVQVARDEGFADMVSQAGSLQTTTHGLSGLADGMTYYWRVRAGNAGGAGPWSTVRRFTTAMAAPAAPALMAPVDQALALPTTVTFSWDGGGTHYTLHVSSASDFSTTTVALQGYTGKTYEVSGLAMGTTYYWRVQAENATGAGPWSAVRSFTTYALQPPSAPAAVAPEDGAAGLDRTVTLRWAPQDAAEAYELEVRDDAGFAVDSAGIAGIAVTLALLPEGRTFRWRVRAVNGAGPGPWSAERTFTTASHVAAQEAAAAPTRFALLANYPNPFNPRTTLAYELASAVPVTVAVYDLHGRLVRHLVDAVQPPGRHEVAFDAAGLPSGTYVYRLRAGAFTAARTLVVLK